MARSSSSLGLALSQNLRDVKGEVAHELHLRTSPFACILQVKVVGLDFPVIASLSLSSSIWRLLSAASVSVSSADDSGGAALSWSAVPDCCVWLPIRAGPDRPARASGLVTGAESCLSPSDRKSWQQNWELSQNSQQTRSRSRYYAFCMKTPGFKNQENILKNN